MRHWPSNAKKKARIEIIPMIDVMMFLLVFFVLISVNVIPSLGVKTKIPNSSQAQPLTTPDKQVLVTLSQDGSVHLDGKPIALGVLAAAIKAKGGAQNEAQTSVVINADQAAQMQTLMDVMDAIKEGGYSKVSFAAKKRVE